MVDWLKLWLVLFSAFALAQLVGAFASAVALFYLMEAVSGRI